MKLNSHHVVSILRSIHQVERKENTNTRLNHKSTHNDDKYSPPPNKSNTHQLKLVASLAKRYQ